MFAVTNAQEVPQLPPVGIIDFYGLRTVSEKQALFVLKIKPGDDAIETLKAVEENRQFLKSLPGVEDAAIHLVCCDNNEQKSNIFVGIREKGTPVLSFRAPPNGKIHLTEPILKAGKEMDAAFLKAIATKDFTEDDSQGHALFSNADVRRVQESYIPLARQNLKLLQNVLHESSDPAERALAAQIIAC